MSGALSWKRRIQMRREENQPFYRSAGKTLKLRIRKKLLDPVRWFREKADNIAEESKPENSLRTRNRGVKRKGEEVQGEGHVKAIMWTGYKLKIVEEVGDKLIDILRTTTPWKGEQCRTKEMTGKNKNQDCTKRSIVYETLYETCLQEEIKKIEDEFEEEEDRKKQIGRIKNYKYIGKTARSAYERGVEHQSDLEKLQEDSHLLKHITKRHRGAKLEKIKFGMKIVRQTRSALERQVTESVIIQEEQRDHYLMRRLRRRREKN